MKTGVEGGTCQPRVTQTERHVGALRHTAGTNAQAAWGTHARGSGQTHHESRQ